MIILYTSLRYYVTYRETPTIGSDLLSYIKKLANDRIESNIGIYNPPARNRNTEC